MSQTNRKNSVHFPLTLIRALLAELKRQLGTAPLVALIVGDPAPKPNAKSKAKPTPAKKEPTKVELPKFKRPEPPSCDALKELILAKLKTEPSVKASQFHDLWPVSEHKRAKRITTKAFNDLIEAKALNRFSSGTGSRYLLVKKS